METKISRSKDELFEKLKVQCGFLEKSARAFDNGDLDEATRMAGVIRILVHDKNQSKSLLGQLDLKGTGFYDTSGPELKNVVGTPYFVRFEIRGSEFKMFPSLDRAIHKRRTVRFEDWWEQPILKSVPDISFSRRDIILNVAEKDGGAHVDPSLPKEYYDLTTGEALGISIVVSGRKISLDRMELYAIRQFTYELLKSIEDQALPNYDLSDLSPQQQSHLADPMKARGGSEVKVGRNAPCPCNSGKKFKKCCGK